MSEAEATHSRQGDRRRSAPVALTWSNVQLETEIVATLDAPRLPNERIEFAFRRKEAELAALFDRLSSEDSRELHRRLTLTLQDDPIATRFARLIAPRRARLLAFLADARRREALRAARCGTPASR
jgi:hypothetical protein